MNHQYIRIFCTNCAEQHDVPVYCGDRFCRVCNNSRRRNAHDRIDFLVKNARAVSSYRMKMLTLTIPNQDDVGEMITSLLKSFRRMRQRIEWKNKVDGGVFVVEITGRPGNWHAHLHIIMQSRWFSVETLFKLWQACSPGRGVWIDDIPPNRAVAYCIKYISKPSVPDHVLDEVNEGMKGLRLFHPFGSWHNLNLTYKKPPALCQKCGEQTLIPLAEFTGSWDPFWKEVDLPPPPEDPVVYRCEKTEELDFSPKHQPELTSI